MAARLCALHPTPVLPRCVGSTKDSGCLKPSEYRRLAHSFCPCSLSSVELVNLQPFLTPQCEGQASAMNSVIGCTEQSLEMQRVRCAWVFNSVFRAYNAVVRQEILSFVSGPSRGPAGFLHLGAWESASPSSRRCSLRRILGRSNAVHNSALHRISNEYGMLSLLIPRGA